MNGAELNYVICRNVDRHLAVTGITYAHLEIVIGALELAKLEIARRIVAPYEDAKIEENGDVFYALAPGESA